MYSEGARWFRTAVAGEWDGTVLRQRGRLDDVIVSGGLKVALSAIEDALRGLPGFAEVAVAAVWDARWGERPVAVAAGPEVDDGAAIAAVAVALGAVGRPDSVVRVAALPVLASGKVDRIEVARLAGRRGEPQ